MVFNINSINNFKNEEKSAFSGNKNRKHPSFKGLMDSQLLTNGVVAIKSGDIIGPLCVDAASMITPRTIIDSTRSPEAGIETFRREISSTANVFLLSGMYALGMGWLLNNFRKNKAPNLSIDNDSIDALTKAWTDGGKNVDGFAENIVKNLTGAVGTEEARALSPEGTKPISQELARAIKDNSSSRLKVAQEEAVRALGAERSVKLHGAETNMGALFRNAAKMHENVFNRFAPEAIKGITESMKKLNTQKTWVALGITTGVAFGLQYLNRYLTKLKTGTDAFVGLPHYHELKGNKDSEPKEEKKENGLKLFAGKVAASALLAYMVGVGFAKSKDPRKALGIFFKPEELYKKLEFKGKLPTEDQMKAFIGATFIGRFWASADDNELRESSFRDIFTYLNWVIIGGLISSGTAFGLALKNKLDPGHLFNGPKPEKKGFWGNLGHVLNKMTQKSWAEIKALKLDSPAEKTLSGIYNKSHILGLVSSGLALGLVTPWLNKHLTNKLVGKKEEESPAAEPSNTAPTPAKDFSQNLKIVQSVLGGFGSTPADGSKRAVSKEFVYSQFFAKANSV